MLGQVITEYNAEGVRQKSYVYDGGALIASTSTSGLQWRYNNPVTGDGLETDAQGKVNAVVRLDPQGVDAGATDPADTHGEPPPPQPLPNAGAYAAYLPHSLGGSGRCSVNGMQTGCAFVSSLIQGGAADECPDDDCSPRSVTVNITYKDGSRRSITGFALVPDGIHTWTGDAARAAVFGWNAANIIYGDNFEIMLKASIGGALLYEQGYRMDARGNFTGPESPQNPDRLPGTDQTACKVMADVAGDSTNDVGDDPQTALRNFDSEFSRLYHGGPIRSIADAQRYAPGNLREINQFYASNGSGFQEQYRDTGTEPFPIGGRMAEQTHHFSAYLSMGI